MRFRRKWRVEHQEGSKPVAVPVIYIDGRFMIPLECMEDSQVRHCIFFVTSPSLSLTQHSFPNTHTSSLNTHTITSECAGYGAGAYYRDSPPGGFALPGRRNPPGR